MNLLLKHLAVVLPPCPLHPLQHSPQSQQGRVLLQLRQAQPRAAQQLSCRGCSCGSLPGGRRVPCFASSLAGKRSRAALQESENALKRPVRGRQRVGLL